ncbi:hypothetical protein LRS05_01895 [Flavobacterium sp. J372]|uniref:hypothetical protein n=1 Tax=Flavobacterium sp. J372 TaxID=2898436 RepID=UPI002151CB1E|nr:hypothetical protein [Flavobacterium sp. J372]MCR5860972.1 hypothetical protein [Flavobacterium sp. J372]
MKKFLLACTFLGLTYTAKAQIMVNGIDITKETEMFDVWAVAKPFSTKESFFVDYGQDGFKPHNYDTKAQMIADKDGKKFEKGEWMKLVKYLNSQGFEEKSSRDQNIGDQKGRIITFVKKKE